MARRRLIDPSFWQSENISRLTRTQRLIFIGLFSNADDQGRLKDNLLALKNMILPLDKFDKADWSDFSKDLHAIIELDSILSYRVDGYYYLQFLNWWKYQLHKRAYPSKFPPPPDWKDKLHYSGGWRWVAVNWDRPPCVTWLTKLRQKIFKRDQYTCRYCGAKAEHMDHVIPRVQGGSNEPENLVAACASCNLSKGGRTPKQAGMELSHG